MRIEPKAMCELETHTGTRRLSAWPGFALRELEIAAYPEHAVKLYAYVPEKAGIYPAILDIHGGGWEKRQIEADKPMMERLATRGFVTALVEYRLSGEAKYPAALWISTFTLLARLLFGG